MSKWQYAVALLVCVVSTFTLATLLSRQHVKPIQFGDYFTYSCHTGSEAEDTLTLHLIAPMFIHEISHNLCQSQAIAQRYGAVTLSWKPRELITTAELLDTEYATLMGRRHSYEGLVPNFEQLYKPMTPEIHFTDYRVYWYSRTPVSHFDKAFFSNAKIGVINDKYSHTHYLLPLTALAQAGVNLEQIELHYYNDAFELYEAFKRSEIDLMSTGSWFEEQYDGKVYRYLLTSDASVGQVYVPQGMSQVVQCEIFYAFTPIVNYLTQLTSVHTNTSPGICR